MNESNQLEVAKHSTQHVINVMQAWLAGKDVEQKDKGGRYWHEVTKESYPEWNFRIYDYRIKPERAEIEVWCTEDGVIIGLVQKGDVEPDLKIKRFAEVIEP